MYTWEPGQTPSHKMNLRNLFYNITDHIEYSRHTFSVTITHSPITLSNLSSIDLVSIFRCSSPPLHPVYTRCVDPSVLDFGHIDTHL